MIHLNNSQNILEHFPNVCGTTFTLFFFSYLAPKKKMLEFCSEKLCYNYLYSLLQLHTILWFDPVLKLPSLFLSQKEP